MLASTTIPAPGSQRPPQVVLGIILPEIRRVLGCPSMDESSSAAVTSRAPAWSSSRAGSARQPAATASWATCCAARPWSASTIRACLSPRVRQRPEAECFRRSLERDQDIQGRRQYGATLRSPGVMCVESVVYQGGGFCSISCSRSRCWCCWCRRARWPLAWARLSGGPALWPHASQSPQSRSHVGPWRVALQEPSSVDSIGTGDLLMGLPVCP